MKVAMIQMHVEKEVNANLDTAFRFLKDVASKGTDIAALPEMFCCPYAAENFPIYAQREGEKIWQTLSGFARSLHIYLVGGTMPERGEDGKLYNTCFVFDRSGRQIAKHRKIHLFDISIEGRQTFRESATLSHGNQVTVFPTEFGKMGVCICYDIRFPELARAMTLLGAKCIFVPAAFNMTTGPAHWELTFRSRALDNQVFYIGSAPARQSENSYVSYGNSIVTNPWGEIISRLGEREDIAVCDIDLNMEEKVRKELPLLKHRREDVYYVKTKDSEA